ncbi:MAG: MoaD/ThiS family protein [Halobacteriales archaeon]|nr:MoaD/ThiS family protein [Halobacteriales archaeon]
MQRAAESPAASAEQTTVNVRCTGHVRTAVGTAATEFSFEGETLRAFLEAFFAEHDVRDLILAGDGDDATRGWAAAPEELPGTWRKNPEGDRTRRYARVTVNGVFNEHLEGLDTVLEAGDRVALMYPFVFCV